MVCLLRGDRIGQAVDAFNYRWGLLSAELLEAWNLRQPLGEEVVAKPTLANRYVARNDARNYLVLGDPAARLRVESMSPP
jgi:hypothetical protein